MRRTWICFAIAVGVAGCGGAARPRAHSAIAELSSKPPAGLARSASGPPVGVTQSVDTDGARLWVTVRGVLDPLRGAGVRLAPHARAIGVLVQIRSAGPAVYDSSATGDFRLVLARGQATPVLARRGLCQTPPQDFDRYITAGEDRVGCVVYSVPTDDPVEGVRFDPHARDRGRLTWTLGR